MDKSQSEQVEMHFHIVSCAKCCQAIHALFSPRECVLKFYMFLIQDPSNGIENGPDGGRMVHKLSIYVEERDFGKSKSEVPVLSPMSSLVPRGDRQDTSGRPQLHQLRPSLWQARAVGVRGTLDNFTSVSRYFTIETRLGHPLKAT